MTLDPTARRLELPDGPSLVLVDTVGFIRDLPRFLHDAFRATFEEAAAADLILMVVDVSDPEAASHIRVVQDQLHALGAGAIPVLYALNKMDRVSAEAFHDVMMLLRHEHADHVVRISAKTGDGLEALSARLGEAVERSLTAFFVKLPYDEARLVDHARTFGVVAKERYEPDGIVMSGRIRASKIGPLMPWMASADGDHAKGE
jgi:GTP-binding protein HflX